MTIALAIPHTPWRPERVDSLRRLESQLGTLMGPGLIEPSCSPWGGPGRLFTERVPNWQWADNMWTWAESTGCDHFLQLQDDVIVDSQFWTHLSAMLEALPNEIIGLESVHQWSVMAYQAGHHWYTSTDCLIGVGYVLPRAMLSEFNLWRYKYLRRGATTGALNEDTMIAIFAMATGRPIWHPVPTIIDHDVSLPSTYGNDHHSHRRPLVTTVDRDSEPGAKADRGWGDIINVRNTGRFYGVTPWFCRKWVKRYELTDYERDMANGGDE